MADIKVGLDVSKKALQEMSTDKFKNDFLNLIKCRYPLFYVTTNEERRFIQFLDHFCRVNGRECHVWNCYEGMIDLFSGAPSAGVSEEIKRDALGILDHIISQGKSYENSKTSVSGLGGSGIKGIIFVLLDFFRFIKSDPDVERRLKSIASLNTIISVVITGPYYQTTDVLENLIPVVDFPYANRNEIRHALYDVVQNVEDKIPDIKVSTEKKEEVLINSVSGLTLVEAQTAFSKSVVSTKGWHIPTILEEKKQIINKNGLLEYFDKTVDLKDVGGLKNLIEWIKERKLCFTKEAEEYGLRKPRGVLLIGLPGSGKSYIAKAISGYWETPLLRLDMGRLFQAHVGESESNARRAIKLAEAVAPACLWIDEIEKSISGIQSGGRLDSGVTSRVLSTLLTWMQEKTSPVFIVATANDHQSIPPEFLRAGRFDEIFFVDLPNLEERKEIFSVHLRKRNRDASKFDLVGLANASNGYSGAEIEKSIEKAMLTGFYDNMRQITTIDILNAINSFKPLSIMREGEFEELKDWAKNRCIKANMDSVPVPSYRSKTSKELEV